jgi:hypothetical protein
VAFTARSPLLRVWIPKSNGGQRPLGIPPIRDRAVQMAVVLVIGPIFEADMLTNQYGFRPGLDAKKHRVLRFVVLPWTLRMTSATKRLQSERYVGQKDANIWSGQERRDHGKLADALWVVSS